MVDTAKEMCLNALRKSGEPMPLRIIAKVTHLKPEQARAALIRAANADEAHVEGIAKGAKWHLGPAAGVRKKKQETRVSSTRKIKRTVSKAMASFVEAPTSGALESLARASAGALTPADEELKSALQKYGERMMRRAALVQQLLDELGA